MNEPIHILSLGAGVQSSTLALMAALGEVQPMPTAAIFADTKAEPASVYRWLEWLQQQLPFPVHTVSNGGGLEADALRIMQRRDGKGCWVPSGIPHYSINSDGSPGHGPRQCTHDFKIVPIQRQQRISMRNATAKHCVVWVGISADEAHRMKPSRVKYAENIWPLVDRGIGRRDCLAWMAKHNFPKPPRSACVFCPYHSDNEWRRLRDEEPREFDRACAFEDAYRAAKAKTLRAKNWDCFLHASRVPLRTVDFSTDIERGQLELSGFGNECEGMCGV